MLDFTALDQIRERRHDLAHEVGKEATLGELDHTCSVIQKQMVAWGLVSNEPPNEVHFERSAVRNSTTPGASFERDLIVRVMNGSRVVLEKAARVINY